MKIQIPKVKFDEMQDKVCCQEITNGYVPTTVFYSGVEYVITGSLSKSENSEVFAYRIVSLEKYRGKLEPLEYRRHWLAVDMKERERCYNGMRTKHGKRSVVFVGEEINFSPSHEGTQTSLF